MLKKKGLKLDGKRKILMKGQCSSFLRGFTPQQVPVSCFSMGFTLADFHLLVVTTEKEKV